MSESKGKSFTNAKESMIDSNGVNLLEHNRDTDHELSFVQKIFRKYYGPVLLKPTAKAFVCILFLLYLCASIWGTVLMPSGLQYEKLFSKDHYVYHYYVGERRWKDGSPLQILLNHPPNVSVYEERQKLFGMVQRLENTPHTMDERYTVFWLNEYRKHLNASGISDSPNSTDYSSTRIKNWITSSGSGIYWKSCVRWGNETAGENLDEIEAFRFTVALKDFADQEEQQIGLTFLRNLLSSYPEYNVTCYHPQSPFVDQYITIYPTLLRNTILSLFVIVLLTLVLIPHPVCGLFMTLSVLSIDVGVSGFLHWWGVNMDCVSMVTIIIGTGIAIDLSAHVSYAYVRAEGSVNERAVKALETLGWPVFQGVIVLFLGVLVMGAVDVYVYAVFFKTAVLVILFGLLHSLVFLPVALTIFVPKNYDFCRRKNGEKVAV